MTLSSCALRLQTLRFHLQRTFTADFRNIPIKMRLRLRTVVNKSDGRRTMIIREHDEGTYSKVALQYLTLNLLILESVLVNLFEESRRYRRTGRFVYRRNLSSLIFSKVLLPPNLLGAWKMVSILPRTILVTRFISQSYNGCSNYSCTKCT